MFTDPEFTDSEWQKLTRYLTGDCSPEEREEIESWINADPHRQERVRELERLWAMSDAEPRSRDVETAWSEVRGRLQTEERDEGTPASEEKGGISDASGDRSPRKRTRTSRSRRQWVSAGIVLSSLLVVAVVALFFATERSTPPQPTVFATDTGEKTRVQLSDGSSVHLNAESKLTVSPFFGEERRVVRLQGEAYFDVTSGTPFVVKARDTHVRVHGTTFGVESYSSFDEVSVVVKEGRVGVDVVEDDAPEKILGPRQRAVVSSTGGIRVTSDVQLAHYLDWRTGSLVFKSTPLRKVMRTLEREYGLRTWLKDGALADRRLTATFSDESLDQVLEVISLSLDVGYRRSDSTVVFGRAERDELTSPSSAASSSH